MQTSNTPTGVGPENGLPGGLGDRDARVGTTAEPTRPQSSSAGTPTTRQPRPPRDFRITEAHRIGQGGLKEKARDNIAAIRTLGWSKTKPRGHATPKKPCSPATAAGAHWRMSSIHIRAASGKRSPARCRNTSPRRNTTRRAPRLRTRISHRRW